MPIATEDSIKAIRGPEYVDRLLDIAQSGITDIGEQLAARQNRLDYALQAADDFISRYLPLPSERASAPGSLRQIADEHALYILQSSTPREVTDVEMHMAEMRERDLRGMRERNQWPGSAENQRNVDAAVVESNSGLSLTRMPGFAVPRSHKKW